MFKTKGSAVSSKLIKELTQKLIPKSAELIRFLRIFKERLITRSQEWVIKRARILLKLKRMSRVSLRIKSTVMVILRKVELKVLVFSNNLKKW